MLKQTPKPSPSPKGSAAAGASHPTNSNQSSAVSAKLRRRRSESTSDKVAQFVATLSAKELPEEVKEAAKKHLLDGFATMLGGAAEEASQRIDEYLRNFYRRFMESEAGHYTLFIELAETYMDKTKVRQRWSEWLKYEAQIMQNLDVRGDRIH